MRRRAADSAAVGRPEQLDRERDEAFRLTEKASTVLSNPRPGTSRGPLLVDTGHSARR